MRARGLWTSGWALAALMAVLCAGASAQVGTGAAGQATPAAPATTGAPQAPSAPQPSSSKPADIKVGTGGGQDIEVKTQPTDPHNERLGKAEGGLTFLPELKPTDGVPDLSPELNAMAHADSDTLANAKLLDRVAAVINGEVILESDVREQQQFAAFEPVTVPGGKFTPLEAMQQIVNRTLLLRQMTEQQLVKPPSDAAVDEQIAELRKHMPACVEQHCETEEGWQRLLAAHGLTEASLHERWKERMQILDFIGVRFRTGIRISKPEIEKYYHDQLVPEFTARKLPPPPLQRVSARIDEVLLQQHVNVLLGDYLRSLKDAGNVQILDPAYNELGKTTAASNNTSPEPMPHTGGEQ